MIKCIIKVKDLYYHAYIVGKANPILLTDQKEKARVFPCKRDAINYGKDILRHYYSDPIEVIPINITKIERKVKNGKRRD